MKKFLGILVALSLLLCAMPLAAGAEETVTLYGGSAATANRPIPSWSTPK